MPSKDRMEFEFKHSFLRFLHLRICFIEVRPSRDRSRSLISSTSLPGEFMASISSVRSFFLASRPNPMGC